MTGIALVFKRPAAPGMPIKLVFGQADGPGEGAVTEVRFRGKLPGLRGRVRVAQVIDIGFRAKLPGLRMRSRVRYVSNAARPLVNQTASAWRQGDIAAMAVSNAVVRADRLQASVQAPWQAAQALAAEVRSAPSAPFIHLSAISASAYDDAAAVQASVASGYADALRHVHLRLASSHKDAARLQTSVASRWQDTLRLPRPAIASGWQEAGALGLRVRTGYARAAQPINVYRASAWQDALAQVPGRSVRPEPPEPDPCYLPGLPIKLLFSKGAASGLPISLLFVCGRHGGGPTEPGATVVVAVRRFYMTINSIALRRVDGNVELPAYAFNMSLDADSPTFLFNATLHKSAKQYVESGYGDDPVELEAMINGVPYSLSVRTPTTDSALAANRIRIVGRGRAAVLGAPYAPVLSFSNAADLTAQQIAAQVLTVNGVSIGWSVDWGLVDWLVPAGAWAFNGTYLDALGDIAGSVGGYVQPHPTDNVLRILPRYPAAPWNWGSLTPDFELPASAAQVVSVETVDQPNYNRVFVGGISQGVFGPFTREGTAGDLIAPQVTHALITHVDALRQRGRAELGETGRQAHVQLSMQVLAETGIILPGAFVRYVADVTRVGMVRSMSLDYERPVMRQTLGIETHVIA